MLVSQLNAMRRCRSPPGLGGRMPSGEQGQVPKALRLSSIVAARRTGTIPARFAALLRTAGKPSRRLPTAGFVAVHVALALCRHVTLFGFGDGDEQVDGDASSRGGRASAAFHYWPEPAASASASAAATAFHHDLRLEHAYYRDLMRHRQPPLDICAAAGSCLLYTSPSP